MSCSKQTPTKSQTLHIYTLWWATNIQLCVTLSWAKRGVLHGGLVSRDLGPSTSSALHIINLYLYIYYMISLLWRCNKKKLYSPEYGAMAVYDNKVWEHGMVSTVCVLYWWWTINAWLKYRATSIPELRKSYQTFLIIEFAL